MPSLEQDNAYEGSESEAAASALETESFVGGANGELAKPLWEQHYLGVEREDKDEQAQDKGDEGGSVLLVPPEKMDEAKSYSSVSEVE